MALIAVKQTTIIRASITAYSTAVGPSSDVKNCFTLVRNRFIPDLPSIVSRPGARRREPTEPRENETHLRRRNRRTLRGNPTTGITSMPETQFDLPHAQTAHAGRLRNENVCRNWGESNP